MGFYYTKAILLGGMIGLFYGEKHLPFPIQYIPKKGQVGNIKIDLSIFNQIMDDLNSIFDPRNYK